MFSTILFVLSVSYLLSFAVYNAVKELKRDER